LNCLIKSSKRKKDKKEEKKNFKEMNLKKLGKHTFAVVVSTICASSRQI